MQYISVENNWDLVFTAEKCLGTRHFRTAKRAQRKVSVNIHRMISPVNSLDLQFLIKVN